MKKQNKKLSNRLPPVRVSNEQLQEIIKRALYFDGGSVSKYIRRAALNYKKEK